VHEVSDNRVRGEGETAIRLFGLNQEIFLALAALQFSCEPTRRLAAPRPRLLRLRMTVLRLHLQTTIVGGERALARVLRFRPSGRRGTAEVSDGDAVLFHQSLNPLDPPGETPLFGSLYLLCLSSQLTDLRHNSFIGGCHKPKYSTAIAGLYVLPIKNTPSLAKTMSRTAAALRVGLIAGSFVMARTLPATPAWCAFLDLTGAIEEQIGDLYEKKLYPLGI